jgi:glycerate kinase
VRVLLAPDSFGGTLTAAQVCDALAEGWTGADVESRPMSDGGPGFLDALPGTRISVLVEDPLARPTLASFLLDGTTAYAESAQAAGLHLLDPSDRDPAVTTTYGVGQLVVAAVHAGASTVVVGLGGSATNDGGAGFLAAMGVARLGADDRRLTPGGLPLLGAVRLVGVPRPVTLVAATDVVTPLLGPQGASQLFGPQKGATPALVTQLDRALTHWADLVEGHLGVAVRDLEGAGAAGGLGFALLALGGTRVSGFEVVASAAGLSELVAAADLVVTGEGRLDGSSLRGKVVSGVAALAAEHGVPCVAVAGEVLLGRREAGAAGLAETYSLTELVGSSRALEDAAGALRECAGVIARSWSPS